MNTFSQKYPIQFYGNTWGYWLAALLVVFPAVGICCLTAIIMALGAIDGGHDVKDFADDDVIYGVIIFIFFILLAVAFTFQICARQRPILKIHKEGLWIRTIGISRRKDSVLGCLLGAVFGFALVVLFRAFIMVWHVITLQLFRIRIVRLRWEDITDVQDMQRTFTHNRKFKIAGWYKKEYNDFEQEFSLEHYGILYDAREFSVPIDNVISAVQFFQYHPDERETLPSWQEEEVLFGSDYGFAGTAPHDDFGAFR